MKCERCGIEPEGHDLHNYCEACSKNLCTKCMHEGRCFASADKKHMPSQENAE